MQTEELIRHYIWINPVVEAMAGPVYPSILQQITMRGFSVVSCSTGLEKVRQDYRACLEASVNKPLIDTRCPLVGCMVNRHYPGLRIYQAQVLPILMVCAQDLYEMYVQTSQTQADLTIVTPCSSLAEAGNDKLGNIARFITWTDFCNEQELLFRLSRAVSSPIPPGFFQFPEYRVLEASGSNAVKRLLDQSAMNPDEADLLELLYCDGGCHNGDGV